MALDFLFRGDFTARHDWGCLIRTILQRAAIDNQTTNSAFSTPSHTNIFSLQIIPLAPDSMTEQSPAEALNHIQQLARETGDLKTHLAIVRISEPISSAADLANSNSSPSKRGSDVSTLDNPTPATLEADLTHYKVSTPAQCDWDRLANVCALRNSSPNCAFRTSSK